MGGIMVNQGGGPGTTPMGLMGGLADQVGAMIFALGITGLLAIPVLAGSAAGLFAGIVAGHSLAAALAVGAAVAIAALAALMRYQHLAWKQVISTPDFPGEEVSSK